MSKERINEKINQFYNSRGKSPQEFLETDEYLWVLQNENESNMWWEGEAPQYWRHINIGTHDEFKELVIINHQ